MSTPTALRPAIRQLLQCSRTHQTPRFIPSILTHSPQRSSFSSTSAPSYPRDMNRERGVSTKRRTGPRKPLSMAMAGLPLPKPVLDPARRSKPVTADDHGLWGFFHSKEKPMNLPDEDAEHGRPWTVEELRGKSWEDLHCLYWLCAKERNRIATESYERKRIEAGYGEAEARKRFTAVRKTQKAIKHVLTERYYSWMEAREVAKDDPEVNLSGDGPAYVPSDDYVEGEDIMEEEQYEAGEAAEGQPEQQIRPEIPPHATPEPELEPRKHA